MRFFGSMILFIAAGLFWLLSAAATAEERNPPDLRELRAALEKLVTRHYPKAEVTLKGDTIKFQYDTRTFMVHETTLDGRRWQDPFEEIGPQPRGIWASLEFRPGRYMEMAAVPQTSDKRYFVQRVTAPYSEKVDGYLFILLRYPRGAPAEFLKDLETFVNGFEKYVAEKVK